MCIRTEHLFLGTAQQNNADKCAKGRHPKGDIHVNSILTTTQVKEIKLGIAEGKRGILTALSRKYGVSLSLISRIKYGLAWAHIEIGS